MAKLSAKDRAEILAIATGNVPAARKRSRSSFREFHEQSLFAQRLRTDRRTRDLPWTATMQGINLPIRVAKMAKAKGVQKGVPDFLLFVSRLRIAQTETAVQISAPEGLPLHIGLALEFKDPEGKGQVRPEQKVWARQLTEQGWLVEYPETAIEGWRIFTSYMGMKE